jgi:hypothetical protein
VATQEELNNLKELLDIYEDRRRHVDKQKAMYGRGRVPSELALESEEIEESIARINSKMRLMSVPQEVQDATGPEAGIDVLRHEVKRFREQLNTALRWMSDEILRIGEEARSRAIDNTKDRKVWQRVNFGILLFILLLELYKAFYQ